MIEVRKTETFVKWIDGLSNIDARARILARTERLIAGNPGVMLSRLEKGFQSYELIMAPVIGCITKSMAAN